MQFKNFVLYETYASIKLQSLVCNDYLELNTLAVIAVALV